MQEMECGDEICADELESDIDARPSSVNPGRRVRAPGGASPPRRKRRRGVLHASDDESNPDDTSDEDASIDESVVSPLGNLVQNE